MNKLFYLSCLLISSVSSNAQIDLQCNARDSHAIYLLSDNNIYRIDDVDANPSEPVLVTSSPVNYLGGISINANLNAVGQPETMYFVANSTQNYYYWQAPGWINTNHVIGSPGAINPGGTTNYIFNLDANSGNLYRYDGTGNEILLLSGLNTSPGFFDVAADQIGNFYIFSNQIIRAYNPDGILIDTFTTSGTINQGTGFAILGDTVYAYATNGLYSGSVVGNHIAFTFIRNFNVSVTDIAACPSAGNSLARPINGSTPSSQVYPNPFGTELHIVMGDFGNFEVCLYDLASRMVLQEKFANTVTIPTEYLKNGIYLYEVKGKNGIVKGKVVKN